MDAARSDLHEIYAYHSNISFDYADKILREIGRKFDLLGQNPALGRRRDEIILNLRSFPAGKYILFYFPNEQGDELGVEIYRVLHSSQNIAEIFNEQFEGLSE